MRRKNILDKAVEELRAAEQINKQIKFCNKEPMWKSYVPTDTRIFRIKMRHWTQRIYAKTCMWLVNTSLKCLCFESIRIKYLNLYKRGWLPKKYVLYQKLSWSEKRIFRQEFPLEGVIPTVAYETYVDSFGKTRKRPPKEFRKSSKL